MRLSDALRADTIVTGASWPDFEGAVGGLVHRLVENGRVPARLERTAVEAILERERVAATAIVDIGVSIPHSRLEGLDSLVSAAALSTEGVFGAREGTPIAIVFLVLSPPSLTGEHLNFLSALSMLLHSAAFRRQLQAAATPEEALAVIRAHERR